MRCDVPDVRLAPLHPYCRRVAPNTDGVLPCSTPPVCTTRLLADAQSDNRDRAGERHGYQALAVFSSEKGEKVPAGCFQRRSDFLITENPAHSEVTSKPELIDLQ